MTELLLQIGLSNACFSLALAIAAMLVGAKSKRPHLAHMLWLLVFIKLITPPVMTIPVATISAPMEKAATSELFSQTTPTTDFPQTIGFPSQNTTGAAGPDVSQATNAGFVLPKLSIAWIPIISLFGSVIVFVFSLIRVFRFNHLLSADSQTAPQTLLNEAKKIALRLSLKKLPAICTTSARISPMVWWIGGKVRIIIPESLIDTMKTKEWKWTLAHELAHVQRKDYLVRWIEWLACVCFWWNPVVWLAQRNLRATEEICCDALVISSLNPKPQTYATSILSAVEALAYPVLRTPSMASEINSGGYLEKRFRMIILHKPGRATPRWLQVCILLCSVVVLPLGIGYAVDFEAVEERLEEAVEEGVITKEQLEVMTNALRESEEEKHEERLEDISRFLKAAVATGMMSEEDAREKWEAIEKERHREDDDEHGEDVKRDLHEWVGKIASELNEAVESKKMTQADAWKKWFKIKHSKIRQKVRHLLKEGNMTEDQAHSFWAELEEGEFRERIKKAVARGDMTEEEGQEKITNYRTDRENKEETEEHIRKRKEKLSEDDRDDADEEARDEKKEDGDLEKWKEIKRNKENG